MNRRIVNRKSGKIGRQIRMAFNNAKYKVPKDTGTLRGSLELKQTSKGYTIYFQGTKQNPKSKKMVKQYIDYVEKYHEEWWENTVNTFFTELSKSTGRPIRRR